MNTTKRALFAILLLSAVLPLTAQVPSVINQQGKVYNTPRSVYQAPISQAA